MIKIISEDNVMGMFILVCFLKLIFIFRFLVCLIIIRLVILLMIIRLFVNVDEIVRVYYWMGFVGFRKWVSSMVVGILLIKLFIMVDMLVRMNKFCSLNFFVFNDFIIKVGILVVVSF